MIYDYYHYNSPEVGNKRKYAYGDNRYSPISSCGLISADNRTQAQTVLNANNRAWQADCILLNFSKEECDKEYLRRKSAKVQND